MTKKHKLWKREFARLNDAYTEMVTRQCKEKDAVTTKNAVMTFELLWETIAKKHNVDPQRYSFNLRGEIVLRTVKRTHQDEVTAQ